MDTRPVTTDVEAMLATVAELYSEVADAVADEKVELIARRWLAKATMEIDDDLYESAMDLAVDLEIFAPSSLGNTTAFDRLAKRRAVTAGESAALAMIRAARMVAFRIDEVATDGFGFGASDLVGGAMLTILDPEISSEALDAKAFGRLGVLPDGRHCVIGPITPLDDAGLEFALAAIAKSQRGAQDHRCAAAVFKHVTRHGNPKVAGLNWYPEEAEGSDTLEIAAFLHSEGKLSPTQREELEADASIDSVMEGFHRAHSAMNGFGSSASATAYVAITGLQLRVLETRFAAGDKRTRRPLDEIGAAIDWEVEHHDFPADARALFLTMRDEVLAEQAEAASKADRPIEDT